MLQLFDGGVGVDGVVGVVGALGAAGDLLPPQATSAMARQPETERTTQREIESERAEPTARETMMLGTDRKRQTRGAGAPWTAVMVA